MTTNIPNPPKTGGLLSTISRPLRVAFAAALFLWMAFFLGSGLLPWRQPVSGESGLISKAALADVRLVRGDKEAEAAVKLVFRNPGEAPLRNFVVELVQDGKQVTETPLTGIGIDAGASAPVTLMPLAELEGVMAGRCPGCALLAVGRTTALGVEAIALNCKVALEKGRPCRLDYSIYPLELSFHFETVYGERVQGGRTMYVLMEPATKQFKLAPK